MHGVSLNALGRDAVMGQRNGHIAESTNAKPHDDHGALKHRHIAVASFRCVTATSAGACLPASGPSCSKCHR